MTLHLLICIHRKKSSPTTISQNSSIRTCSNSVKKGTDQMQDDDSTVDRFFTSQGIEPPYTPHMTPEDFENVRKVWYIVGRKHLAIPMVQHMFKQVFNYHADARFLTKANYQLVVYAPKKESVSNSFFNMFSSKINGANQATVNIDSIDSFVTSHTIYFWRTLNSIISHRKDSSWGVERLTELYSFHRNIFLKTGVPTRRHYQTFLEAMNDFMHKNLRHHCEQEQRDSFHKFVNVIYYFMNYCEPDMKPWCETYP